MTFAKSKILKIILWVLGILIAILLLTNPSVKRFKEYKGYKNYDGLKRTQEWFIFSIYQSYDNRYVGIFSNFFKMN